jgi:protein TonB
MTEAEPEPELPPPEPDIKMPELPQMEKEEAVVMQPPKPPEEKKPPKPVKREPEKKKKIDRDKPKAVRTTAPAPSENASDRSAAPASGAASNNFQSRASWRSEMMAHLNRYKRFPPGASAGTSSVTFTISRSGQVLSARLSRSSGDSLLDQEAVALVHRASPVPAPPSDMGGGSISLSVPVRFGR